MSNSKKSARDKIHQKGEVPIKVSVIMITYNHEEYIAQAVNSVLMQEADFNYELVIGEDCSTDGTREIVEELQIQHPEIIRLELNERNLGAHANFVRTLKAGKGQYAAVLEGDDYWLVPNKLQMQVDFLDSHRDCSLCFTNSLKVSADGQKVLGQTALPGQKPISTLEDLVERNFIANCTILFRRGLFAEFPDWYTSMQAGDWAHHVLNAEHGDVGYIDEITTAYRKHPRGMHTSLEFARMIQLRLIDATVINSHLNHKYEHIIRNEQSKRWEKLEVELVERGYQLGLDQVHEKYVSQIFDAWPPKLPLDPKWKKGVLGAIYEKLLFKKYEEGDYSGARYCWLAFVRYRPSGLANRGAWTIGVELVAGQRFTNFLRYTVGRVIS